MMNVEDVISALEKALNKNKLVLYKSMNIDPKFKIKKNFLYKIYDIENKDKSTIIYEWNTIVSVPIKELEGEGIKATYEKLDKEFLNSLINDINKGIFNKYGI